MDTEVEVSGIAEFDDILPDGSFYLYRFIIFCCAADATPSGLIIYGVDAGSVVENRWYRLRGKVSLFNVEGKDYIAIEANSITETEEPANPYEYYY